MSCGGGVGASGGVGGYGQMGGSSSDSRSGSRWSGSRSGGSAGDLVEHSLVKCTRHAGQGEFGREGKVRVSCRCWVGQARGGEANEVVASVGADGRVNREFNASGGGDIDRVGGHNGLQKCL